MIAKGLCVATLFFGLAGIVTARAQATPPPNNTVTPPSVTVEQQGEMDAAKTNVRLVKTQPKFVSGPPARFPEEEKQLGHHGKVVVTGLLGVDGKMRYLTVATSSRAPVLDQSALEATSLATFQPAKDAAGRAIPIPIAMPHDFLCVSVEFGGWRELIHL